ncbi:uncharacterized protein [Drosophila takahashii]|uniref:uncharacterized protein n=1 Tax=Drosophila takahashii TaxID=29030 RepID=UPI003898D7FF
MQDYYLRFIPQAVPIIVISAIAFGVEVIFWIKIALSRHDVAYTANSAACDNLETRNSYFYPAKYLKFLKYNQRCEVPSGLILAKQGDTAGPSFNSYKKRKQPYRKMAGPAAVSAAALSSRA